MVQLRRLPNYFLDEVLDSSKTPNSSQTSLAPASSWPPLGRSCSVLRWLTCLQVSVAAAFLPQCGRLAELRWDMCCLRAPPCAAAACAVWHNIMNLTSQQLPPACLQMYCAGCFSSAAHPLLLPYQMDDWSRTCP